MVDGKYKIFALNPGSTSTKIAMFYGDTAQFVQTIEHRAESLGPIQEQLASRRRDILEAVEAKGYTLADVDVFAGRGGAMYPCEGGIYEINDQMLLDAQFGPFGEHPARLSSRLCDSFRREYGGKCCVVDPPDTDELDEEARITGLKDIYHESRAHALNQKAVAQIYAGQTGKRYEEMNLIFAHLGGGISISAHRKGRIIDTNDILHGGGPIAPTRCGYIAPGKLIELCFSGKYTEKELHNKTHKNGGLVDLLGTADVREVHRRIEAGDRYARLVLDGMILSIARSIGARAASLKGQVDQILFTGGISKDRYLVEKLREHVQWISPVQVFAGEFEMEALGMGALQWLRGERISKEYTGHPVWTPPV